MPKKTFWLDDDLAVTIYKRKSSRQLRLSVAANGEVRVGMPTWAPYKLGVDFARSRRKWIIEHAAQKSLLSDRQAIGKAHHLEFIDQPDRLKIASRISGSTIKVYLPTSFNTNDDKVQQVAYEACVRALRLQAETLLPKRLADLASKHGYQYNLVSIKRLKGRWGSCDHQTNIVLNLFLMQLPWHLIDYVLLHELTHTKILRHGPIFWAAMSQKMPDAQALRRDMKAYSPVIDTVKPQLMA